MLTCSGCARAHAQTDKKNLGAKAMLAEIKEIGEKRRAGEAASLSAVFSSSAPFGSRLHADLTFNYSNRRAGHFCPVGVLSLMMPARMSGTSCTASV